MRKSQISTEYLIILGVTLAAIIPAGYFFYSYSRSSSDQTIRSQIEQIGSEIVVNSESVYGLAEGSLVTVSISYPNNIREVYILNRNELIIRYEINSGVSEAVFFSKVPMSGSIQRVPSGPASGPPYDNSTFHASPPAGGKYNVQFESKTSYVLVRLTE